MACILLWSSAVRVHDSQAYRKMDVTRERISGVLELREIFLPLQAGFSLVSAAVVCAIQESISGLEPSSVITEPKNLKLVTVSSFCPYTLISVLMHLSWHLPYCWTKKKNWKRPSLFFLLCLFCCSFVLLFVCFVVCLFCWFEACEPAECGSTSSLQHRHSLCSCPSGPIHSWHWQKISGGGSIRHSLQSLGQHSSSAFEWRQRDGADHIGQAASLIFVCLSTAWEWYECLNAACGKWYIKNSVTNLL